MKSIQLLKEIFFLTLLLFSVTTFAQQPNPPGQVVDPKDAKYQAYLFAHMTHQDYGRLYYSVSLDGLHWYSLNNKKRVFDEYHGHPDICKGHDGRYYIAGNSGDDSPDINIWVSADLIDWQKYSSFTPNLKSTPDYSNALQRIGAPKLFYDESSKQYVISWHTPHKRQAFIIAESLESPA